MRCTVLPWLTGHQAEYIASPLLWGLLSVCVICDWPFFLPECVETKKISSMREMTNLWSILCVYAWQSLFSTQCVNCAKTKKKRDNRFYKTSSVGDYGAAQAATQNFDLSFSHTLFQTCQKTSYAKNNQANFKLPPLQRFFIYFLQNFSVFSILIEGDRVEKWRWLDN